MIGYSREDLAHEADDTCFTCFSEKNDVGKCSCNWIEDDEGEE